MLRGAVSNYVGVDIPGEVGKVKYNDFWDQFIRAEPVSGYSGAQILQKLDDAKAFYPYP